MTIRRQQIISTRYTNILSLAILGLLLVPLTSKAGDHKQARLVPIDNLVKTDLRVRPLLSSADTCFVTPNGELIEFVEGWVSGAELYKSLIDPAEDCSLPYPYTVREINMPMAFAQATDLIVSVDIEMVDSTSYPGCTLPGEMLSLSQDFLLQIPVGGGAFNIWIPLDSPVVVNGPFFAGFFIGNFIDPIANPSLIIDSKPVPCATFNIWDESIGWIDLTDNQFFNFPGRIAMEVSGVPGGQSGNNSMPMAAFLEPKVQDVLYGSTDLWVMDSSGASSIDFAMFEYSFQGGSLIEIGRDFDGFSPLRDGRNQVVAGDGFSVHWDFSNLTEGSYIVVATLFDLAGNSSAATTVVTLEPTPPTPTIVSPVNGSNFCQPLTVLINSQDEDLSFVQIEQSEALSFYSAGIVPFSQFKVGDANNNPGDGNLASAGEFGDYYNGPVAAAMALKLWDSRGVTSPGSTLSTSLTIEQLSEHLASLFLTRENLGTIDELLYAGLDLFLKNSGGFLELEMKRIPDYWQLREWVEEQERAVILSLSGAKGVWVTVDGFGGWQRPDGARDLKIANPLSGTIELMPMRKVGSFSEILFENEWQRVDMMVSFSSPDWNLDRQLIGIDADGNDGWSVTWTPVGLQEKGHYFFRASSRDESGYRDANTVLISYQCGSVYANGDYDDDGVADVGDLILLMDFITIGATAPVGGGLRADANCDNFVNIADIVYYINFLFGATSQPCY